MQIDLIEENTYKNGCKAVRASAEFASAWSSQVIIAVGFRTTVALKRLRRFCSFGSLSRRFCVGGRR